MCGKARAIKYSSSKYESSKYESIQTDGRNRARGFALYRAAERIAGAGVSSCFPYEDNLGLFEEMDGWQLLRYLTAAQFHAVRWEIVPGTCYERAVLGEVDASTPEYREFERELYEKVLERMGFQGLLTPGRDKTARVPSHPLPQPKRGDTR